MRVVEARNIQSATTHKDIITDGDADHGTDVGAVAVHEQQELGRRVDQQPGDHAPGADEHAEHRATAHVDPSRGQVHGVVAKGGRVGRNVG